MNSTNNGQGLITEEFCTPGTSEGCGNGLCNAEGTFCTCFGDYVHDNTQLLFPNCFLTNSAKIAILTSLAVMCAVLAIWGLTVVRGRRGMPRLMCQIAIASLLLQMCHLISLGVEGKPGIASIIFLIGVDTSCGCMAPFIFLWVLVSPALELMMLQAKQPLVWKRMKQLTVVYLAEQIFVYIPALVFQYQGNYMLFNIIYAANFFFISLYTLCWAVAVWFYAGLLFKQMDKLIASMKSVGVAEGGGAGLPETSTGKREQETKIEQHRKRLGTAVFLTIPLCISGSLVCALFAATYFGFGVHPYRFVIFIIYSFLFPSFSAILIFSASKKKVSTSSSEKGSNRDRVAPMHGSSSANDGTITATKRYVSSNNEEVTSNHGSSIVSPAF